MQKNADTVTERATFRAAPAAEAGKTRLITKECGYGNRLFFLPGERQQVHMYDKKGRNRL